ncbi:hypothetical protein B0H21DRAFT_712416 [Amylocystis lapponica]|nr:hypothetical protein B0H21DRAFT_712416 [Amylocystis lapponica]
MHLSSIHRRGFVLSADSTLALAQAQSSTTLPGWISFDFCGNPPGTGMGVRRLLVLEPDVVVANLVFGNGIVLRGLTSISLVLRWPGFAQHEFEKNIRVVGINGLTRGQLLDEVMRFIKTAMGMRRSDTCFDRIRLIGIMNTDGNRCVLELRADPYP